MTEDLYEAVAYPGVPFPQTHPDRLFTVATLHGLAAARPERCSVLELGCGDGLNLVAIAAGLPGARAVGLDRTGGPLRRGRGLAEELGLGNVELHAADLQEPPDGLGTFDYVVAHGVCSWVPAPVRHALLALIGRSLAPGGVAFVSYNALPGCHVRRAVRDLMRFHARSAPDLEARLRAAREAVRFAARFGNRTDPYGRAFEHELERIAGLSAHSLVHDDLGEAWEPLYLRDFAAEAGEHALRYLADAELSELRLDRFPPGFDEAAADLAAGDVVAREQYADLIAGRAFRQTLLVASSAQPAPEPVPDRLGELRFAGSLRPDPVAGEWASVADAALAALAQRHPQTAGLDELVAAVGAPRVDVAAGLLAAFRGGLVDVHAREPAWANGVPHRPAVSPLARLMARDGTAVVTLDHALHGVADPVSRRAVTLMDGSRDRDALLQGLVDSIGDDLVVEPEGGGEVDAEALRAALAALLDDLLPRLAGARLLRKDAG